MKTKTAFTAISITVLLVALMLITAEAYYVAIALVVGTILFGHRELWALITKRKMPPFDERIQENVNRAVRNGFVFLVCVLVFLMLPFKEIFIGELDLSQILAALIISGGLVYVLSYFYFEKSRPNLGQKRIKLLKAFLITAGASIPGFILGAYLHNAVDYLFHFEEPVFFIIAVIVAPAALVIGLLGSFAVFLKGLLKTA